MSLAPRLISEWSWVVWQAFLLIESDELLPVSWSSQYSPVTGEFHSQRLVTQIFDIFFGLHQNKRWVKKIETPVIWDFIVLIMP